jgi:hypothetical protein
MSILDTQPSGFDDTLRQAQGGEKKPRAPSTNDLPGLIQSATNEQIAGAKAAEPIISQTMEQTKADKAQLDTFKPEDMKALTDSVKPWKPEEHPDRDPIQAFSGIGAVFAMLAAGLSKQPMVNALNAGAELIKGQKSADKEAYDRAYSAWKENMDMAFKKHNAMIEDYKVASEKMKTNLDVGIAEAKLAAQTHQDIAGAQFLQIGAMDKFFQLQNERARVGMEAKRLSLELQDRKERNDLVAAALKELPPGSTPEQVAATIGGVKARLEGRITDAPTVQQTEAKIINDDAQKKLAAAKAEGKTDYTFVEAQRDAFMAYHADLKKAETASGGGSGARESVMNQRVLIDAKDATTALQNMIELPVGSTGSVFGGATKGEGMFGATKKVLLNKITSDEAKAYDTIFVGIGRALSGIEVGGLQVNKGLADQFEKLKIMPGDDHLTAALKLAQMRQDADNGLDIIVTNPHLSADQKAKATELQNQLRETIPWTVKDAIRMQFGGHAGDTFKSWTQKEGVTGAAVEKTYKVGDTIDGPDGKKYKVTGGDPKNPEVELVQ